MNLMLVGAGGALGAMLRYLITLIPLNPDNGFPVKTFVINIIGSFVIGLVAALTARNLMNERVSLFLRVGVCGGFTTFSSFALETEGLMTKGSTMTACLYVICSIVIGTLMVFLAEKMVGIN